MLGFVFCIFAASTEAGLDTSLALVKTSFTGVRPIGANFGAFAVDVRSLTVNLRGCSVDGISAFLSAHGSVFVESTIFQNAGAPIPQEKLSGGVYEDREYTSQVQITDGSFTFLRCEFKNIETGETGSAINAQRDQKNGPQMLNLTETNFTDCTANWGVVFSRAASFVLDGCTIERCAAKNSIVHCDTGMSVEQKELLTISRCSFVETSVVEANKESGGAGLVFREIKKLEFIDCLFSKNERAPNGGGVYGDWIASLTDLTISGCEFRDLTAYRPKTQSADAQMKNGGCFVITHKITFTAIDCTFDNITCWNGGILYLEENPGITELVIQGCTITRIEAINGGIAALERHELESFAMCNTIVDNLETDNDWLVVKMGAESVFIFDNNTVTNMPAQNGTLSRMIFVGVSNETIALSDCTFVNTASTNFAVEILQDSTQSFTIKNCHFIGVETTNGLNAHGETPLFVQQISLDNCVIQEVHVTGGQLFKASSIELLNCDVRAPVLAENGVLFAVQATELNVANCLLTGVTQGGQLFTVEGTDVNNVKVTLMSLKLSGCSVPLGSFSHCSEITINDLQMTNCKQALHVLNSAQFILMESNVPGLTMDIQADQLHINGTKFPQSQATASFTGTGTFEHLDVSIGLTISGTEFTFSDCCFQNAAKNIHYLTCQSQGTSIIFVEPICFDKSRTDSLNIASGIEESSTDGMFNCHDCDTTGDLTATEQPEVDTSSGIDESDDIPDVKETTTSDGDSTNNSKLPPGAIAGIAVAAILVVIALIIVIILVVLRRKKKSNDFDDDENEMFDEDSSVTTETLETTSVMGEGPQVSNPLFSHMEGDEDFSSVFEEAKDDL